MLVPSVREDEDYLMLSGIQHFAFCPRQWALIHIEQQWQENVLTTEGNDIHRRVDDKEFDESRGDKRIVRSVPLVSERLRIRGIADMVELTKQQDDSEESIVLGNRDGLWRAAPVEYKRGKPKPDVRDAVQLCAQAICLEEMLRTSIPTGFIYYHEIRRRENIIFTDALRDRVEMLVASMWSLYEEARTPRAEYKKHCMQCSLLSKCKPKLSSKGAKSASAYIVNWLERMDEPSDDS